MVEYRFMQDVCFAGFWFLVAYYVLFPVIKILFSYTVKVRLLSRKHELLKYGSWAVVTGATDGIGLSYAQQLAELGLNIFLVSRTQSKLDDVASLIESKHKVKTMTVAVDFTKPDIYNTLQNSFQSLDIGTLVNNVGMSYDHPNKFSCPFVTDVFCHDLINCNVASAVRVSKIILPIMIKKGKGGAIINISSMSAIFPLPMLTIYSASKVFLDYFSRSLSYELKEYGIIVQAVLPGFVSTKLSKMEVGFLCPSPDDYVRSALNMFGVEERTFGCIGHSMQAFLMLLVPKFVLMAATMRKLNTLRKHE